MRIGSARSLIPRALRIAGSLAIVLVAYSAYALLAVPWIEPSADVTRQGDITDVQRVGGKQPANRRLSVWKDHFPADAWELGTPKILESDRLTLLMQDYHNVGDGQVELRPCTIIFTRKGPPSTAAQRRKEAVILRAPEGALLRFDGPIDLRRAKIGQLISGRLEGRIKISGKGRKPGPEDDLEIVTRDVELTQHEVQTPHRVDFRLGPNHGRGAGLRMRLAGVKKAGAAGQKAAAANLITSFALEHVERLHLEVEETDLGQTASAAKAGPGKQPSPDKASGDHLSVEITCRGPFYYDNIRKTATFNDHVDLLRINPTGPADRLSCEKLAIFFIEGRTPGPGDKKGAKAKPAPDKLRVHRIEAHGKPVDVLIASEQPPVHARGERLVYIMANKRIVLDAERDAMLKQGPNWILARSLQYLPAESKGPGSGGLGQIAAVGPGQFHGEIPDEPGGQLDAKWNERLQVRPAGKTQLISLTGGTWMKYGRFGQLEAGEIHFWLSELPDKKPSDKFRLQPDRMLASENVRVTSPELSSFNEKFQVWFETAPEDGPKTPQRPVARSRERGTIPVLRPRDHLVPCSMRVANAGLAPIPGRPQPHHQPPQPPPAPKQHFQIVGRTLQAKVRMSRDRDAELSESDTKLSELVVEDGVKFVETRTADPNERPVVITGDRIKVVDANTIYTAATVTGWPARFDGRGLTLTGPNINLNQGTNRLWVDGPGAMKLPMDSDLTGRRTPRPGTMTVEWQEGMLFDGQTARFSDAVSATAPGGQLQTEALEIQMRELIRFSDKKIQQKPFAEKIICRGNVYLEGREFEIDEFHGRRQKSYQRMQMIDLTIDRATGDLTAKGPGWLSSARFGSNSLLTGQTGAAARDNRPQPDAVQSRLYGLTVRFEGDITGNEIHRMLTFHDRVRTAYAPIDAWTTILDVDDPDALGPGGVVMNCDRLTVSRVHTPAGDDQNELAAEGNVFAEGKNDDTNFNARAARMTYAQAKKMLVLQGDGWTDAELFRQEQFGGPASKVAARRIEYWPQSQGVGRLRVGKVRQIESTLPSPSNTTGPRPNTAPRNRPAPRSAGPIISPFPSAAGMR